MPFISGKRNKKKKDPTKFVNFSETLYFISPWLTDNMYLQMALVSVNLYMTHEIDTHLLIKRVCVCYQTKELKGGTYAG